MNSSPTGSAAFTTATVRADGFDVSYAEAGSGPNLVMIHGGDGLNVQDDVYGLLAKNFRVIALEMPGWGSVPNTRTKTLKEMGGTIAAAIAALGLDPVVLVGTSIGAPVALWAALGWGAPASHLVLESPAAFRAGGPERSGPPDPSVFNFQPSRQRERHLEPRVMQFMMSIGPHGVNDPELAEALAGSDIPVLTVFGEHEQMFPPAIFAQHYEKAPRSKVVVVDAAAHDMKGDRPEVFASLVRTFVDGGLDAVPDRVA
jgi:pimeloyl-ACP methyl ester carboxylesterase